MKKHLIVFSMLATLAILTACGGAVEYPNYYTLHMQAPDDPPVQEGVHTSLAIREFRSPAYLRQGAIVYKTSPEQIRLLQLPPLGG